MVGNAISLSGLPYPPPRQHDSVERVVQALKFARGERGVSVRNAVDNLDIEINILGKLFLLDDVPGPPR
jgi:hypothetical protein